MWRKLFAWLPFGRNNGDDERDSDEVPEGLGGPLEGRGSESGAPAIGADITRHGG